MSELLSLSGVCFNAGGRQILNDVSLSVAAGEVVSLIGPNGAGKSTLLGVIAGDIAPSGGEILLDGALWVRFLPVRWRVSVRCCCRS